MSESLDDAETGMIEVMFTDQDSIMISPEQAYRSLMMRQIFEIDASFSSGVKCEDRSLTLHSKYSPLCMRFIQKFNLNKSRIKIVPNMNDSDDCSKYIPDKTIRDELEEFWLAEGVTTSDLHGIITEADKLGITPLIMYSAIKIARVCYNTVRDEGMSDDQVYQRLSSEFHTTEQEVELDNEEDVYDKMYHSSKM